MNSRLVQLIIAVLLSAVSVAVCYFTGQKGKPDAAEVTCEMAQAIVTSEACAPAEAPAEVPVETPVEAPSEEVPSVQ